jgi:MoxR-like ATPase
MLVIDEVSMVNADVMDAISTALELRKAVLGNPSAEPKLLCLATDTS